MKIASMHKRYTSLLLICPLFITAQEINPEYLDTLPDSIREDVMLRMDEAREPERVVYRTIDSTSNIEKEDEEVEDELVHDLFGRDFFDTMQTSFMPVNTPNLDDSYVLDFSDVLSIQITGQNSLNESHQVSRDGSISLLDIGKIYVGGLSLKKASSLIESKVKQAFIGTEVYITLTNIRDVSVMVAGDAFNPGVYTLNGNSNMLHALHVAGGISDYGSYRKINLIRDEQIIETLDIYDILIHGKFSLKQRLRSGDLIFVEPQKNLISLEGAFNREATFELTEDQSIGDAVGYANGLSFDADISNILLYRLIDGAIESLNISNISQLDDTRAKREDKLFIRRHDFRNVVISGAVLRPGRYKMVEGETISDLIETAGGFSTNAFPEGSVYLNLDAREIGERVQEMLYEDFIDGLLTIMQKSQGAAADMTAVIAIAEELKETPSTGRMIIDIFNEDDPVLLKEGDSLMIPEKTNNIFIYGEILNSGSVLFKEGAGFDYYFNESSGLKETADTSSVFIIYPNGRTERVNRKRNIFAAQPETILEIKPGSIIYVPRKIDDSLSTRLTAQAYATILGNISVTLASLAVIK
jgi:protein involved in polysaccharide export with SLBB domain